MIDAPDRNSLVKCNNLTCCVHKIPYFLSLSLSACNLKRKQKQPHRIEEWMFRLSSCGYNRVLFSNTSRQHNNLYVNLLPAFHTVIQIKSNQTHVFFITPFIITLLLHEYRSVLISLFFVCFL